MLFFDRTAQAAQRRAEQERDLLQRRLDALADQTRLDVSRRGLFVVGHARSGTTVLQNALNDSPDVYLCGEAHFHSASGAAGFPRRYNAQHRSWKNQETKGTYCPILSDGEETWWETLRRLADVYRYVGDKIVVNTGEMAMTSDDFIDFYSRNFYASQYIFTFREPAAVLRSTQQLWSYVGAPIPEPLLILNRFITVIQIYIRMVRTFPHVSCVFHDDVSPNTFDIIGGLLDIDLSNSYGYYDQGKVVSRSEAIVGEISSEHVDEVIELYDIFRNEASKGFRLLQLGQNDNSLDNKYFTPMGRLAQRVDATIAKFENIVRQS